MRLLAPFHRILRTYPFAVGLGAVGTLAWALLPSGQVETLVAALRWASARVALHPAVSVLGLAGVGWVIDTVRRQVLAQAKSEADSDVAHRSAVSLAAVPRPAEQVQQEFLSVVSHELRTPLTSMQGALGLLSAQGIAEDPVRAEELLAVAQRSSERLAALVADILDLQKLECGRMPFYVARCEVGSLIEEAVTRCRTAALAAEIDLLPEVSVNVAVFADRERLLQALCCLISNATKFSPPQSQVEVVVHRRADRVRFEVRDHGPGVPEDLGDRIFDPFTLGDASTRRAKGGTGLGLSIARAIIVQMHGSIGVEAGPDVGSIFFLELPVYQDDTGPLGVGELLRLAGDDGASVRHARRVRSTGSRSAAA